MRKQPCESLSLFGRSGNRKYLNAAERWRFLEAVQKLPSAKRLFCEVLAWTGGRLSEVLSLTPESFDLDSGAVNLVTLKRRRSGIFRQVPLSPPLLTALEREFNLRSLQRDPCSDRTRIWGFSRTTAWRLVKRVMAAAGISGTPAMPKGLRHGFCVNALQSGVPITIAQRWLGHASLRTTGIYADLAGAEERAFAETMWKRGPPGGFKSIVFLIAGLPAGLTRRLLGAGGILAARMRRGFKPG